MGHLRRLVSLLMLTIGCFWQLRFICRQYFAYDVTTRVMIEYSTIPPPEFSVCSTDWFGYFQPPTTYFSPADIDQMTPPIDDVFKGILFRNWTGNRDILKDDRNSTNDPELRSKFFQQQKSVKMQTTNLLLCYSIKYRPEVEPRVELHYQQGLWLMTMARFNSQAGFAFIVSSGRHGFYGIAHEELTMLVDDTITMLRLLFDI